MVVDVKEQKKGLDQKGLEILSGVIMDNERIDVLPEKVVNQSSSFKSGVKRFGGNLKSNILDQNKVDNRFRFYEI